MGSCCSRSHVRQDKQPGGQLPEMAATTNQLLVNADERSPSIPYMTSNGVLGGLQGVGSAPGGVTRWGGGGGELPMAVSGTQTGVGTSGIPNYYGDSTQEVPMSGATLLPGGGLTAQGMPGSGGPGYATLQMPDVSDPAARVAMAGGGEGVLELHSFTSTDGESEDSSGDDGRGEANAGALAIRAVGPDGVALPPPSSAPTPFAASEPRAGGMAVSQGGLMTLVPTPAPAPQGPTPAASAAYRARFNQLPSQPLRFDDDISMVETRSSAFDTPLNFDDETTASEMSSSTATGWMGRSGAGSVHASRGTPRRLDSPASLAVQLPTSMAAQPRVQGAAHGTGATTTGAPLTRQASNPVITVTSVRNNKTTPMHSSRPVTPRQFLRQESFQSSVPDLYASDDLFQSCRSLTQSELMTASAASTPRLHALRPTATPVAAPPARGATTGGKGKRNTALRATERPPLLPTPQSQRSKVTAAVARRGSAKDVAPAASRPLGVRSSTVNSLRSPISTASANASLASSASLSRLGSFQTCRSGSTVSVLSTRSAMRSLVVRGSGGGAGRPISAARVTQPATTTTTAIAESAGRTTVAVPPLTLTRSAMTTPASPAPLDSVRTEMLQTPASPSTVSSFVSPVAAAVPPTPWQDEVPATAPLQSAMSATDREDVMAGDEPTPLVYHLDEDAMQPPPSVHVVLPYVSDEEAVAAALRLDAFSTDATSPSSETQDERGTQRVTLTVTADSTVRALNDTSNGSGSEGGRTSHAGPATTDIVETIDMDMEEAVEAAPSVLDAPHDERVSGESEDKNHAAVVAAAAAAVAAAAHDNDVLYLPGIKDEEIPELHTMDALGANAPPLSNEVDRVVAAAPSASPPPPPSAQDGTVTSSYATLSSDSADVTGRQVTLGQAGASAVVVNANHAVSELTAVTPPATVLAMNGGDGVDSAERMRAAGTLQVDATTIPTATAMQTGPTSYAMWSTANGAQMQLPAREASVQESSTTGNVLVCELSSSPSLPPAAPALPPSPPPPPSVGELGRGANPPRTYSSVGDSSSTTRRQPQFGLQPQSSRDSLYMSRESKVASSNGGNSSSSNNKESKKRRKKTATSSAASASDSRGGKTGGEADKVGEDTRTWAQQAVAVTHWTHKSAASRLSKTTHGEWHVDAAGASASTSAQHSAGGRAGTTTRTTLPPSAARPMSQSHRRSAEEPRPRWNSSNVCSGEGRNRNSSSTLSGRGRPSSASLSRHTRGLRGGGSGLFAPPTGMRGRRSTPTPTPSASLSRSFSGRATHGDAEWGKLANGKTTLAAAHRARRTKGRKPLLSAALSSSPPGVHLADNGK